MDKFTKQQTPGTTPFLAVATRAMELGCVPQFDPAANDIVLHPRLLPGNWRIGVVVKPERAAA